MLYYNHRKGKNKLKGNKKNEKVRHFCWHCCAGGLYHPQTSERYLLVMGVGSRSAVDGRLPYRAAPYHLLHRLLHPPVKKAHNTVIGIMCLIRRITSKLMVDISI